MIWAIFFILLILWILGLLANIGGSLIHLLLLAALLLLAFSLIADRKPVV